MKFIDKEITLRYAVASDAEQLTAWWNDGAVMAHAGFPNGLETTIEETLKNINNVSDDRRRLFIIDIGGVAVGEMSFRTESAHTAMCRPATLERYDSGKIAEIGIKICREDYQGKGYGTRILRLFTRALFNHYGFDIITLDTNLSNTRAQRVYENVGFERVEVKENAWQSHQTGEWATVVYYEMAMETKYVWRNEMIYENTPTITTERLILRKFTADDAEALFAILKDVEVNTFLPWFPPKDLDEVREFLQQRFLDYYEKFSAYRYAICLKADNIPIGYVGLADNESCDLGYGLKKEHWHKGIATEAVSAVVERIKNAGYTYITATHDVNNPRSGEVMKKLGMVYKYSYIEQWQPKDIPVTFRLYQLNFDRNNQRTYSEYWDKSEKHFIEEIGGADDVL